MANPTFDLVDVIRTIQKKKRFIIIITVIALALGGLFLLVKKKKYKAEARFLVNNPLYGDRNTLFRSFETRYVDYFGGDDDLDKITAFANSDTVRDLIIRKCQFQEIYKQDINTPKGHAALMGIFNRNFNLKRSEYKDMEVTYIAYDAQTAATVANTTFDVLEATYRYYYKSMKEGLYTSINDKLKQVDSTINVLTDSLANMRERYNIYSIISPTRQNVIYSDVKGSGKGFGKAIEQVQNIEAVKDQLVTDRAHYISNLNEFSASENDAIGMLKLITRALPPQSPSGAGVQMVLLASACLGLFFSTMYVLMMAYFRKLNEVVR
jgi:LPS O-antigen subunit length determinant protein (WzzB/FepE family)